MAQQVDVVLESEARVAGEEVKAASTVTSDDFRGLRKLKDAVRQNFASGVVVLYVSLRRCGRVAVRSRLALQLLSSITSKFLAITCSCAARARRSGAGEHCSLASFASIRQRLLDLLDVPHHP